MKDATKELSKTGFFSHEECFWHSGGNYALTLPVRGLVQPLMSNGLPENPETKRRFKNLIELTGLSQDLDMESAARASITELETVHTNSYLNEFRALSESGGGEIGLTAPFGAGGFEIASRSAGLVIAAVESVLKGELENAYALSRPPGHHCMPDFPNGFCLLNNIGIAVKVAKAKNILQKVAIVDWDVHHGNGTEAIFYSDPNVFTISLHQERNYPLDTGSFDHRGDGAGKGFNLNIPLPPGSGHRAYIETMRRIVLPSIETYKPDLILVACGFDASGVDPLSRMLCSSNTFKEMTGMLVELAKKHCDGRLVMAHEGGYSEVHVPFCGHSVLQVMSSSSINISDPLENRIESQQPSLEFDDFVFKIIHRIERELF